VSEGVKAQPHYPLRPSAIHGPNPKECAKPGTWHRIVLTNPVRCCSAFVHTPNAPTTLDPRCSALGCEPGASYNGQAIGSGQAAAPIHRIHDSNEHPVGGTKTRHAEEPVSAAGTALRSYYLSLSPPPPHTARAFASGRQRAYSLQCPSRPPPAKKRGKSVHCPLQITARLPYGSPLVFAQKQTGLLPFGEMWQNGVKQAQGLNHVRSLRALCSSRAPSACNLLI
jgi:hypothetical protein